MITLIGLTACTSKAVYESIQQEQIRKCEREPNQGAREHCLQGLGVSHRDYERMRKASSTNPN